jgi:hypothetical protein
VNIIFRGFSFSWKPIHCTFPLSMQRIKHTFDQNYAVEPDFWFIQCPNGLLIDSIIQIQIQNHHRSSNFIKFTWEKFVLTKIVFNFAGSMSDLFVQFIARGSWWCKNRHFKCRHRPAVTSKLICGFLTFISFYFSNLGM